MKLKYLLILMVAISVSFIGCEEDGTTEAGLIINNTSGGAIEVTVEGTVYELDIDGTETITWEFEEDESRNVDIAANGRFVLDYETTRYISSYGDFTEDEIRANATCVQFINATGADIVEVYISTYTMDAYNTGAWGDNFLTAGAVISNGSSADFTVDGGSYDLKVVDSNGNNYSLSWLSLNWFNDGEIQAITVG